MAKALRACTTVISRNNIREHEGDNINKGSFDFPYFVSVYVRIGLCFSTTIRQKTNTLQIEKSRLSTAIFPRYQSVLVLRYKKDCVVFLIRCKGTAFFHSPQEQIYVVQHVLVLFCFKICLRTFFADYPMGYFLLFQRKTYCVYRLSNSITSRSLISDPSIIKRSNVCTVCQPCLPAAPGFIVSICQVLSYCTFNI